MEILERGGPLRLAEVFVSIDDVVVPSTIPGHGVGSGRSVPELSLSLIGRHFEEQLPLLEAVGEGNRPPVFSMRMAEFLRVRNKWVRIPQGRRSLEALCWDVPVREQVKGDFLVEFYGKARILRAFTP